MALLALTFALSAGDAFETPTWRAIFTELVEQQDLAAASALNGIEFNFARAVGPALAGLLIATAGVGAAFIVNVASFVGVIVVIARWKRPTRRRATPPETVAGATIAALRYVRFSPTIRALIFRAGAVMFCASALLALLPAVARSVSGSAKGYGLLLGCFGAGAVIGALAMQRARDRWSTETVASWGIAILGLGIRATGAVHSLGALCGIMLIGGAAWIVFISLASALLQSLAPDWVRARVLAMYMLVFQGGMAAGSVLWGALAARENIHTALLWSGLETLATTALGFVATWAGMDDPLMLQYHDREWGVPVQDDRTHFEFLVLEGAQAGLSWSIVLKKGEVIVVRSVSSILKKWRGIQRNEYTSSHWTRRSFETG
jgi:MFS family permease